MRRKIVIGGIVLVLLAGIALVLSRCNIRSGDLIKSKDGVEVELAFCVVDFNSSRTGFRQRANIYLENKNAYPVYVSVTATWKDGSYAKKDYELVAKGGPVSNTGSLYSTEDLIDDKLGQNTSSICRKRIESVVLAVTPKR